MLARLVRLPQAERDIDDIWLRIARDNPAAADSVIDRLAAAEQRLCELPGMGRLREELASSLRSWPVGDYLIFYRAEDRLLTIVRVLHGARDLPAEFDTG